MNAYVINGNDRYWHKDPRDAISKQAAAAYLSSLNGCLPAKGPFDVLIDACLNFHLVTPDPTVPQYEFRCNCKFFCSKAECSHIIAATHLAGRINIFDLLRGIERPAIVGRPSKIDLSDITSVKYIGIHVAVYDDSNCDIPLIGKIIDSRPLGASSKSKEGDIYYKAEYLPQRDLSETQHEEMTLDEVLRANRVFRSYMGNLKKIKK
jgi:hypothetical protein